MQIRRRCLPLCVFLSPALAQDAVPSAETLLRNAIAAEKAQNAKDWKFTWREDEDKFPSDKNGKPLPESHRTFDNIMLEGEVYRKLILIDGKPPGEKLQKKIDSDMERERAARRAHPAAATGRHEVRVGDLDRIARMCDSKVAGEEMASGRMTWRVESLPKADYKPADKDEEKFLSARRVTWFDAQEGVAISISRSSFALSPVFSPAPKSRASSENMAMHGFPAAGQCNASPSAGRHGQSACGNRPPLRRQPRAP